LINWNHAGRLHGVLVLISWLLFSQILFDRATQNSEIVLIDLARK